jgi:hypothetical protein
MEQFDDIDRALFALPLEEPPQGLRESILSITAYGPQVERARLNLWENLGVGVALALLFWGIWAALTNPGFATATFKLLFGFAQSFATPVVLYSLALGFLAICVVTFVPLRPARIQVRSRSS